MILKQISFFLASYFLREKMSRPQSNWISDSTKALTYSAITSAFLNKFSALLKKSIVVIPLVVFGTVLGIICYLDLMEAVDHGVKKFAPSFLINLTMTVLSFGISYWVLKSSRKEGEDSLTLVDKTAVVTDPLQNVGLQIQENIDFFKRGFEQGLKKYND